MFSFETYKTIANNISRLFFYWAIFLWISVRDLWVCRQVRRVARLWVPASAGSGRVYIGKHQAAVDVVHVIFFGRNTDDLLL